MKRIDEIIDRNDDRTMSVSTGLSYLDTVRAAQHILTAVQKELCALGGGFHTTGNSKVSNLLYLCESDIENAKNAIDSAVGMELNERLSDSRKMSGAILSAALGAGSVDEIGATSEP